MAGSNPLTFPRAVCIVCRLTQSFGDIPTVCVFSVTSGFIPERLLQPDRQMSTVCLRTNHQATKKWHPSCFPSCHRLSSDSGSYDESVRIWDARALRTPVSTIATGGGLWRLKWHPDAERGNLLLAACMHAGMRVVDTGLDANDPLVEGSLFGSIDGGGEPEGRTEIVSKYTRHASMAYGADWCRLPTLSRSKRAVIASCSFYDSLLCLWQTPPLWTQ